MARAPFGNFVAGLGPNMRRNIGNTIAGAANPMTQSGQMGTMNNFNMTPMGRGGPMQPMGRPAVNKPPMFGGGAPPQWMPGAGGGMTNPNIPGPPIGAGGPNPMGGSGSAMGGTGMTNPNIPGPGLGAGGPAPMGQGFNGPPLGAGGPNPMIGVPSGSTGGADPYAGTGGGLPPVDPYAGTGGGSPVYQPPGTGGLDPLPNTPTTGGEDPVFNPYGGTGGGLPPANPLNKGGGGGRRNPFQPSLTQFGQRPALPPMGMMQRDGRAAGAPTGPAPGDGHTVEVLGESFSPKGDTNPYAYDRVPTSPTNNHPYNPPFSMYDDAFAMFNRPWNGPGPPPAKPNQYAGPPMAKPQPGPPLANPYRNIGGLDLAPGRRGGMGNTAAGMALGNGTIDRGQIGYGPDSLFSPNSGIAWGSDPYGYGGSAQDSMNGYGAVGSGFANAGYGSPSYGVNPTTAWNEQNSAQREGFSYGGYGDTGGATNGGGKVVCTAMNEAYGFGSFRNAIWLKHSAGMHPAYQRGYHAIFLPLLAYGRGGSSWPRKAVWTALQHIARHRTADLRAEMRGAKRDTLGRVYRALLEPLCFIVGRAVSGR
jgi:hypothetical protein